MKTKLSLIVTASLVTSPLAGATYFDTDFTGVSDVDGLSGSEYIADESRITATSMNNILKSLKYLKDNMGNFSETDPSVNDLGKADFSSCTANQITQFDGTNWACVDVPSGADNLGDHTATTNLDLGTNQLVGNGGSSGIYVDADGSVGIGATALQAKLQVDGRTFVTGNGPLVSSGAGVVTGFRRDRGYGVIFVHDYDNNQYLPLRLVSNVGIGKITPTEKLEVAGNVKATAFIGDGSQLTGISSGGALSATDNLDGDDGTTEDPGFAIETLADGTTERPAGSEFVVTDGGNFGIGTTSPATKLDVNGKIRVQSNILGTCDATTEGAIAYESDENQGDFKGCLKTATDTYEWKSLTGVVQ
jgi:hypothetical protein